MQPPPIREGGHLKGFKRPEGGGPFARPLTGMGEGIQRASSRAEAVLSRRHGDPQSGVSEGCAKETLCAPAAGRRDGGGFLHSRGDKGVEGSGAGLIFPAKTVMIEMERTRRPGCGMAGREGYRDGFFE